MMFGMGHFYMAEYLFWDLDGVYCTHGKKNYSDNIGRLQPIVIFGIMAAKHKLAASLAQN